MGHPSCPRSCAISVRIDASTSALRLRGLEQACESVSAQLKFAKAPRIRLDNVCGVFPKCFLGEDDLKSLRQVLVGFLVFRRMNPNMTIAVFFKTCNTLQLHYVQTMTEPLSDVSQMHVLKVTMVTFSMVFSLLARLRAELELFQQSPRVLLCTSLRLVQLSCLSWKSSLRLLL